MTQISEVWNEIWHYRDDLKLLTAELELEPDELAELWSTELDVQPEFKMYNKICHMRRNIGFFSDHSDGYSYTGQTAKARPLTDLMRRLLILVNDLCESDFNGLLFNLYQDGNDNIGAHRDNEKNLTEAGVVALSLGASRKFRVRDYWSKKILINHQTGDGELMWMQGERFHKDLTHEVPVEKKVKKPRLSITFRRHLS